MHELNKEAIDCLTKAGFTQESILKHSFKKNDEYFNEVLLAKLVNS